MAEGTTPFADFGARPKTDDLQREEAYGSREAAGLAAAQPSGMPGLSPELKAKLESVCTATLSSQLRKRGLNNVSIDGLTSTRPEQRIVGLARTLRYVPNREDLFKTHGGGFNAQKQAIDSVDEGEILVMEARGEKGTGTIGDILALRAQVRGAAAIITDGGVRDFTAVAAMDMPTYYANPHPAVLGRRHVPWDTDITIACGGTTVQPGDIIVGGRRRDPGDPAGPRRRARGRLHRAGTRGNLHRRDGAAGPQRGRPLPAERRLADPVPGMGSRQGP